MYCPFRQNETVTEERKYPENPISIMKSVKKKCIKYPPCLHENCAAFVWTPAVDSGPEKNGFCALIFPPEKRVQNACK